MNKIKNNIIPFFIALTVLVACGLAWFVYHPSSPYHKRYSFVVSYQAIGTLSPGNRVSVLGIPKGEITGVDLTDDAVFVTARVLADTKIPRNSEFRLINSGLMGEREMCIILGNGSDLVAGGDTLQGHFDEGTSGVSIALSEAMEDLDSIKSRLTVLLDSIINGSTGKQASRVVKKGKNLLNVSESVVKSRKDDAVNLLDKCDKILEKAKGTLEGVSSRGQGTVEKVDALMGRVDELLGKVKGSKQELEAVAGKLGQDDNTAGLILAENGEFAKELDRIAKDIDSLIADIKKSGVKLNVDIF